MAEQPGEPGGKTEPRRFQNQDAMALVGYEHGAERSRLFWSLLWCEGSKLKLNIPETTLLENGVVTMSIFTGKDGRVMKRARQNTSYNSLKARCLAQLGDEIRSSPDSPASGALL